MADGERLRQWVGTSEPLVDSYPQRLSPVNRKWKDNIPVYRKFMNSKLSLENFILSENVARFWPPNIKDAAKEYFSSRWVIDDLLMGRGMPKYSQLFTLHQCLHNPLLNSYIPWALHSVIMMQWNELLLRIYLLTLMNDNEKADRIARDYIEAHSNPGKAKAKLSKIIDWARQAIRSEQLRLWGDSSLGPAQK